MSNRKGRKQTEATKEKIRKFWKDHVTPEFRAKMSQIMKGRKRREWTVEEKEKMRLRALVKKEWNGRMTTLIYRVKRHFKYHQWRKAVLERDDYTCIICSSKINLRAHHKIPIADIIQQNISKIIHYDFDIPILWDLQNGTTYCKKCHGDFHLRNSPSYRITAKSLLREVIDWDNAQQKLLSAALRAKITYFLKGVQT